MKDTVYFSTKKTEPPKKLIHFDGLNFSRSWCILKFLVVLKRFINAVTLLYLFLTREILYRVIFSGVFF